MTETKIGFGQKSIRGLWGRLWFVSRPGPIAENSNRGCGTTRPQPLFCVCSSKFLPERLIQRLIPSNSNVFMDNVAKVFLVDGSAKAVRYDEETTVEASPFGFIRVYPCSGYASNMAVIFCRAPSENSSNSSCVFALCPNPPYELLLTESKAFFYLHDQVFCDFLQQVAWKADQEAAVQLAALKVCRDFSEKQPRACVDQRYHLDGIDVDSAFQKFLPNALLCNPAIKQSSLRKKFVALIKKFNGLPPQESVLRSLSILIDIVKFDVEIFNASIGAGWTSSVDLLVGPEVGISYRVNERCDITRLCELRAVLEVTLRKVEHSTDKTIVQLKLSGAAQSSHITVATYDMAESLAHLIDGYQMMFNQGQSISKMKGLERCESHQLKVQQLINVSKGAVEHELRVKREHVTLKELIGGGQFGNVYKGVLVEPGKEPICVAIKVCKLDNEPADTQLILQESHLMKSLSHEHIISLVGVCMDSPIWLVMELAPLGELRQYLQAHKASLDLTLLIQFSIQVAMALQYLHDRFLVHRDVAARNVLVSSRNCVKLTDFGLSRALDSDAVYTASRGKLPIKWLAPESINFREFSMSSDVWMFGVCLWEILSWGVKPWSQVANSDVITQIEAGARPLIPDDCPLSLYNFLERQIWNLKPERRPTMHQIMSALKSVEEQLKKRVRPDDIRLNLSTGKVPVLVTNISAVPNLTLWKTLEEQRKQAEEDDKWLEEVDEEVESLEENKTNGYGTTSRSLTADISQLSLNSVSGKGTVALEKLKKATMSLSSAVDQLNNSFSKEMRHETFLVAVRYVTAKLQSMFSEATELLTETDEERRRQVEMTEVLIGNDMRQMSEAMQKISGQTQSQEYHAIRLDVVRIARDMANNCEQLLTALTPSSSPHFQALLSDC